MQAEIERLLIKMCDPEEKEAYFFADKLGKLIDDAGKDRLIELIKGDQWEIGYLAARALSNASYNEEALDALFETMYFNLIFKKINNFTKTLKNYEENNLLIIAFSIYVFWTS